MTTQTEVKHTPGPWNMGYKDLGGKSICYKVYGGDNQEISTVGRWDSVGDEANARLIASAPDLLKVCKEIYKILPVADPKWIEIIKKAEGRI